MREIDALLRDAGNLGPDVILSRQTPVGAMERCKQGPLEQMTRSVTCMRLMVLFFWLR